MSGNYISVAISAVLALVAIGQAAVMLRQAEIADTQTKLLENQADLQKMAIKLQSPPHFSITRPESGKPFSPIPPGYSGEYSFTLTASGGDVAEIEIRSFSFLIYTDGAHDSAIACAIAIQDGEVDIDIAKLYDSGYATIFFPEYYEIVRTLGVGATIHNYITLDYRMLSGSLSSRAFLLSAQSNPESLTASEFSQIKDMYKLLIDKNHSISMRNIIPKELERLIEIVKAEAVACGTIGAPTTRRTGRQFWKNK